MARDKYAHGVFYPDVELICFDGDGTLWNTEEDLLFPVHTEMLAARGHVLTEEQYRRVIGRRAIEAASIMVATFGLDDTPEAYMQERRERANGRLASIGLMPGVQVLLDRLVPCGASLAIVSAAQEAHITAIAEARDIRRYFKLVVSEETTGVERTKPRPDPYLFAARHFGAKAHKCVAFEDTAHGAVSARDAGMRVVGVPHRFSPREDLLKVCHYVLPEGQTLGDFDLRHIARFLPQ
ncbi:MAG: HAD-IA family hydrolase [Patescibacteria group bacterium]|nr:MAG: HAD-IA family hydrolase [Patescibacteria group bacterium]